MNQELEQYLKFFTEYKQRDWLEWLATAEFAMNNKVHSATKILFFMANYKKELQIGANIRRKSKVEKIMEFVERMRSVKIKDQGLSFSLFFFLFYFLLIYLLSFYF